MGSLGDSIAGGLAGLACVLAGQPFDTVKVKMQAYPNLYTSTYQAFRKTLVEERIRGFYAGSSPAVLSNISENAVLFLFYNQCLKAVKWAKGIENDEDLTLVQKASAGSLASVFSTIAITPPDQVKCKMQAHIQTLQRTQPNLTTSQQIKHNRVNAWIIAKQILHKDGVRGLFRGLTSTWAREVPGYFLFFGGYNLSRKMLTPKGQEHDDLSISRLALAGGLGGCGFWISVFPTDTVKSRIQVRGDYSGSFWKTMISIIRNEGLLTLYKGLTPTLIRSFPANGALFVTYEYSRQFFQTRNSETLPISD